MIHLLPKLKKAYNELIDEAIEAQLEIQKQVACISHRVEKLEQKDKPKLPMGITSIRDAEWKIVDVKEK